MNQKNSYDAVLSQQKEVVIAQFKNELDNLKKSIVVAPATQMPPANAEHDHDEEDIEYDDVESGDKYAEEKEFTFNKPT